MRSKIILGLLSLIILTNCIRSQTLKLGFRVEPTLLFIEKNNSSTIGFTPYSIYLTTLIQPVDNLMLEVRPGYLIAYDDYWGFEIGGYLRYNFLPKFYLMAGLNNHSNLGGGDNGGVVYQKYILYKCVGIGYQKDSKLSFDISYYWTGNNEFGYSWVTDKMGHSSSIPKKMNGILKVGFSLAWDIF